jgi:hypothetical protein
VGEIGPRGAVATVAYRAHRVERALRSLQPALGTRMALIGDYHGLDGACARVVPLGASDDGPRTVVGLPHAVPLASGALTGVLLAHALPPDGTAGAETVLEEACRLLQPGGFVLLLERVAPGETGAPLRSYAEIVRLLRAAGLAPGRRVACHVTPSWAAARAARLPRLLWGIAAALEGLACRLRLARPAEVTCLLAARKAGGLDVDYPDLRSMLGGMLIPPRWLQRARSGRSGSGPCRTGAGRRP